MSHRADILRLRREGLTWRQICAELGVEHSTVGRVLSTGPVTMEIVCTACADFTAGRQSTNPHEEVRAMTRQAHDIGWVVRDGCWYCPGCRP